MIEKPIKKNDTVNDIEKVSSLTASKKKTIAESQKQLE